MTTTIPIGWKWLKLEEVSRISSGGTPSRKIAEYWNGNVPWVTTTEVNFRTIAKTQQYITEEGVKKSSAKWFPVGTILMAMYGQGKTRGQVALLGIEATTNQACCAIIFREHESQKYYFHYLSSQYKTIRDLSNAGGQKNLSAGLIKKIKVPVPTMEEQQKIVEVLETWDEYLEKLDRVIELKKDVKRGLMQQLLTGKLRLSGFSEEWKSQELQSFIELYSGYGFPINRQGKTKEKYPFLKVSDMNLPGNEIRITNHNHSISEQDASELKIKPFKPNSVIFPKIGAAVATNKKRLLTQDSIVDNNVMVATAKDHCNPQFIFQWLLTINLEIWSNSGGVPSIRKSTIQKHIVSFPSLKEQTAIAQILTTADEEIEALEQKKASIENQKKFLLNNLITGKIRFPEFIK